MASLDEECAVQSELYLEATDLAADAAAAFDAAKQNLETIKSRVDLELRNGVSKPSTTGRLTDAAILAFVEQDPRVTLAKTALAEARRNSKKMDGIVTAFDHKRSMLNNVVELVLRGFAQCGEIKGRITDDDIAKLRGGQNAGRRISDRRRSIGQGATA